MTGARYTRDLKSRAAPRGARGGFPSVRRRLAIGAEIHDAFASFRVWAPKRNRVDVVLDGEESSLTDEGNGYFSGILEAAAGSLYRFRLDGSDSLFPDPASRYQPDGLKGPSELIDPASFAWRDRLWRGSTVRCPIIYEMHIGTFTREGTWAGAIPRLTGLSEIGVTHLEIMPVAEFPGRFGWGYDGVKLFAPYHGYGRPDDFRAFVDAAHLLGLSVILDVVYNHLGPDGNCLSEFSDSYFTDRYQCEWGDAFNFDGDGSHGMRELVTSNARYWIDEFHLDGLRLDATQQIFDSSWPHILAEIGQSARAAAEDRKIYIVCENEPQDVRLVKPSEDSGYGFDALWNDDFHHSATVAATGQERAYFSGFLGTPQEFISAAKYGFLFQGQYYEWQGKPRGSSTFGLPAGCFVNFIQNHDQIANTGFGNRIHELTSFGCYKALTAVMILLPGSPMLFQGQEFMASSPFLFFADHATEIADAVRSGRAEFLAQFPNLADPSAISLLPAPDARETFLRCVLDHDERHIGRHAQILELHRDLIRLRVMDDILAMPSRSHIDGAVLSHQAFLLRWWGGHHHDLLLVNLGRDLTLTAAAEPLLAPPSDVGWTVIWDSEDVRYGGAGVLPVNADRVWKISACSAILLRAPMPPANGVRSHSHPATSD